LCSSRNGLSIVDILRPYSRLTQLKGLYAPMRGCMRESTCDSTLRHCSPLSNRRDILQDTGSQACIACRVHHLTTQTWGV